MPDWSIRRYEPRDYGAVWQLHIEGVSDSRSQYPVSAAYEDDLRGIEGNYLGDGSNFWVAEADDKLVGMTAIERIDDRTGRLRRMRVTESWRQKGMARALLDVAVEFCRECGYDRVILDTTHLQTAAHRLYERYGFTKVGEHTLGPFTISDYEMTLS